jgi:hypothetical protein
MALPKPMAVCGGTTRVLERIFRRAASPGHRIEWSSKFPFRFRYNNQNAIPAHAASRSGVRRSMTLTLSSKSNGTVSAHSPSSSMDARN